MNNQIEIKDSIGTRIVSQIRSLKRRLILLVTRFRSQKMLAVYENDLDGLLHQLNLYDDIVAGKFKCAGCSCTITRENLGVVKNENGAIRIYCISTGCKNDIKK